MLLAVGGHVYDSVGSFVTDKLEYLVRRNFIIYESTCVGLQGQQMILFIMVVISRHCGLKSTMSADMNQRE